MRRNGYLRTCWRMMCGLMCGTLFLTAMGCATPAPTANAEVTYRDTELPTIACSESLRPLGRTFYDEKGLHTEWSCAGVEFGGMFRGEVKAKILLAGSDYNYLYVVVDDDFEGATRIRIERGETTLTLANVTEGYHTFRIQRSNSSPYGDTIIQSLSFCGALSQRLPDKALKLEFIGDSITAGEESLLGTDKSTDTTDHIMNSDGWWTYAAIATRALNADANIQALPGYGLNSGADIPALYDSVCGLHNNDRKWDFSQYVPDAVIVNLGTNDYRFFNAGEPQKFVDLAKAFIAKIQERNPNAHIFWIAGMMNTVYNNTIKKVINDLGDSTVHYVAVEPVPGTLDGHPDVNGHTEVGNILADELRKVFPDKVVEGKADPTPTVQRNTTAGFMLPTNWSYDNGVFTGDSGIAQSLLSYHPLQSSASWSSDGGTATVTFSTLMYAPVAQISIDNQGEVIFNGQETLLTLSGSMKDVTITVSVNRKENVLDIAFQRDGVNIGEAKAALDEVTLRSIRHIGFGANDGTVSWNNITIQGGDDF